MKILKTTKKSSIYSYLYYHGINWFPCFRRTGGRVIFLSSDFQEVHIKIPLNWMTRNPLGTIFGGAVMSASDPFYMFLIFRHLGKSYIVWDKETHAKFIKPAKKTLYAKYLITNELIESIKRNVQESGKYILNLDISFIDEDNIVYAALVKTLYIASKAYYLESHK